MFRNILESKLTNFAAINLIIVRNKTMIKPDSYREYAEFKKRDIRYKTSTQHRPKLMSWNDYQTRKWKADHWNRRFASFQAKMDFAESLCHLGMSTKSIEQITLLTPHVIEYFKRKIKGNIVVLRPAPYSNYVNSTPGCY